MIGLFIILCELLFLMPGYSHAHDGPALTGISPQSNDVGRFELFEISLDISARYDNPFDPDDVNVEATFISPSGKVIRIPGFIYQDFTRSLVRISEKLEKSGRETWKVRFSPSEEGRYEYSVTVRDRTGQVTSEKRSFTVHASKRDGFIHRSPAACNYLTFDSGKDYFAVGENVAWSSQYRQTYDYERYFDKLSQNGCNYSRIWSVSWGLGLEWSPNDPNAKDGYGGIGRYSHENSWRLDRVFHMAEERDIHLMVALGNYGDLMIEKGYWNEQRWDYNPYNTAHGGPCASPRDFWTKKEAKDFYKKRLRYIIARWGYSTSLLSLEFWNEVAAPKEWVEEMANYIKEIDPYRHLVTISLGSPPSADYRDFRIWDLDGIDIVQLHLYGYTGSLRDHVPEIISDCFTKVQRFRKPFLVGEFGIDSGKDDKYYDKAGKGVNLHNGLWAAACSGSFGGAMNWWWDTYVEKKDLYYHYRALSNFVKTVAWSKGEWKRLESTPPIGKGAQALSAYSDVVIRTKDEWRKVDTSEYTIQNDGQIIGGLPNKYLYGTSKEDLRVTPTFIVNYPQAGKFIARVGTVSQGAQVSIFVDGEKVLSRDLPAGEHVAGKEGRCEYKKEWDIWWCHYNEDIAVDVSAGTHVIRLENTGPDWAGIGRITLTNYRDASYLDVRVTGLARDGEAVAWIQHTDNNWDTAFHEIPPRTFTNISFDILTMPDGDYQIEWWDTYKGAVIKNQTVKSSGGKMRLEIPELSTDIACILRRQ